MFLSGCLGPNYLDMTQNFDSYPHEILRSNLLSQGSNYNIRANTIPESTSPPGYDIWMYFPSYTIL